MVSADIREFPAEKPVGMLRETARHEESRIKNAYPVWNKGFKVIIKQTA
jgi:hypothetical protein